MRHATWQSKLLPLQAPMADAEAKAAKKAKKAEKKALAEAAGVETEKPKVLPVVEGATVAAVTDASLPEGEAEARGQGGSPGRCAWRCGSSCAGS